MAGTIHNGQRSVVYGRKTINFSLLYCDRKTMEIAVHPDAAIVVKAPVHSDITLIEKKVIKRSRWILRQLNYFKQFDPKTPDRCYVNGETHLYLGRQYRLKLKEGAENSVKLYRGFFYVTCSNEATPAAVKKLLNNWYLKKAQIQFAESMDRCWQKLKHLDIGQPQLSIMRMRKRWGSLSDKGTITLNIDLIRAPKECIDYVVTHELCHLKYHDHSPEFYKLLEFVIPEWEKIKRKLELSMV
ncbi:MAG: M48 family metallopeptidase [Clostridiales bacterium]|jgi:predicted metal-dependent hydrolase|nr:M48 family metallopeptidase [Clostridiales bacterium]